MMKTCARVALAFVAAFATTSLYAGDAKPAEVSGKWELTREFNGRTMTTTFDFQQEGETLKGTATGGRDNQASPLTGTIKGNEIKFSYSAPGRDGQARTREYTGKVEGDSMTLEFETQGGKREATAKRAAKADAKPKE